MLKTKSVLQVKINERNYCFQCDPDSPLGEIFDALLQMRGFVLQKMQEIDKSKEEKT